MARQLWAVGAGALLGLLVLAATVRADEAAAVKAIEKLGGWVGIAAKRPGKPVVFVDLTASRATDRWLEELKAFKSLQELHLGSKITDAGLKELKEFKELQRLSLSDTQVTDAGLKELKTVKTLQTLWLHGTAVTDGGLKELKEFTSLQMLYLSNTKVTDVGLTKLTELKSLQELDLDGTPVTDAGLKELKKLSPGHNSSPGGAGAGVNTGTAGSAGRTACPRCGTFVPSVGPKMSSRSSTFSFPPTLP